MEILKKEIKLIITGESWERVNKLLRAMFTTLAYMEGFDIEERNQFLNDMYKIGSIEELDITRTEFRKFMSEDLGAI